MARRRTAMRRVCPWDTTPKRIHPSRHGPNISVRDNLPNKRTVSLYFSGGKIKSNTLTRVALLYCATGEAKLKADPWATDVQPTSVSVPSIQLGQRYAYYQGLWQN